MRCQGDYHHLQRERRPAIATVTKVMSEFLASRNYRWQCSRDDPVDKVALASFGRDLAESADHGEGRAVVAHLVRNRPGGLVAAADVPVEVPLR